MTAMILKTVLAIAVFGGPVVYVIRKEMQIKKASQAISARVLDEPLKLFSFLRVFAVLLALALPIVYFSSSPFSFYSRDESSLKVAFKHSGKRVEDCNETDLIKKEGERYREMLRQSKQVQMNVQKLGKCSRERFPVMIELSIDGKKVLDRAYVPTGLKKDMASYIFEEFIIKPGQHEISMSMKDNGPDSAPAHTITQTMELGPGAIALLRFEPKENRFLLEQ